MCLFDASRFARPVVAVSFVIEVVSQDVHCIYDGKAGLVEARFFNSDIAVCGIGMPGA
ncbi:MAG: hypothetical protein JF606_16890 [Burkholderiales bacterium]|jgi:hypothetical protein|nr:hypothetical protein [Burkholderiales bacterium]